MLKFTASPPLPHTSLLPTRVTELEGGCSPQVASSLSTLSLSHLLHPLFQPACALRMHEADRRLLLEEFRRVFRSPLMMSPSILQKVYVSKVCKEHNPRVFSSLQSWRLQRGKSYETILFLALQWKKEVLTEKVSENIKTISVNSTQNLCISRVELPLASLWWQIWVKVYTSLVILIAALGAGQKPPLAFLT